MHSRRKFLLRSAQVTGLMMLAKQQAFASAAKKTGLADTFKDNFFVGTAIATRTLVNEDTTMLDLIAREFNAITAENCMKWGVINPEPGVWDWEPADRFVAFGEKHGMCVVGHTLVWHSQAPGWLFKDDKGGEVSAAELNARMERHIEVLAGRYKGKIHTWDVVNEAINEDQGWRKSPWFNILGPEFMERAFHLAHQVDPDSHLIYNDYNMHNPGKREFLFNILKDYVKRGVPIHGVGMQGHVGLDYPDMTEFENTMKACVDLGLALHVTELDVDVLPVAWEHMGAEISTNFAYSDELNPYVDGLPDKVQQQLTDRYVQLFELFLKYEKHIARITTWGTTDAESWKNDFPVRGRTNYPLLFDRNKQPKPAYHAIKALKG